MIEQGYRLGVSFLTVDLYVSHLGMHKPQCVMSGPVRSPRDDGCGQRVETRLTPGRPPARRNGPLPVDLAEDRHQDGVTRRRTVFPVDCAEYALGAGLAHKVAKNAMINRFPVSKPVVSRLRDALHSRMAGGLGEEHQRRVLEIHGRESRTAAHPSRSDPLCRPPGDRVGTLVAGAEVLVSDL